MRTATTASEGFDRAEVQVEYARELRRTMRWLLLLSGIAVTVSLGGGLTLFWLLQTGRYAP